MPNLSSGEDRCSASGRNPKNEAQLRGAIAKLRSLHDGDLGLIDALMCGRAAIPPLRALLFERERSGIYQPRCRAAKALGMLGAYGVLREFLALRREIADPVERTGEDAVINAAARALPAAKDASDFELLLNVLQWRVLPGVIESVGSFGRPEAIPSLIDALVEDDCRPAAEAALRRLGRATVPALVSCAAAPPRTPGWQSDASRRQRRSALTLLLEIGISPEEWDRLRYLMNDPDPKIAVLACKLGVAAQAADKNAALARLHQLFEHADWMLAENIESFLAEHCQRS